MRVMGSAMFHLVIMSFIIGLVVTQGMAMSDEKRLTKFLIDNYQRVGKTGRPVFNTSETVHVQFGLSMLQLLEVDAIQNSITIQAWSTYKWNDFLLRWSPEDFGGVDKIVIPSTSIWNPTIKLYNKLNKKSSSDNLAIVSKDGTVFLKTSSIYTSTCSMDLTHFPYDEQRCMLKFGSIAYDGFKMDIDFMDGIEEVNLSNYVASNEWNILAHPAQKNVKYYPCCMEPYPDLTFEIRIKRVAPLLGYYLTLPMALLTIITIVLLCLPPNSSNRMFMSLGVFAGFLAVLWQASCLVFGSSLSVPLIVLYCAIHLATLATSIFSSLIFHNLAGHGHKGIPVPFFLKKLCMSRAAYVFGFSIPRGQPTSSDITLKLKKPLSPKSKHAKQGLFQKQALELLRTMATQNEKILAAMDGSKGSQDSVWFAVGKLFDRVIFVCYIILVIWLIAIM